MLVDTYQSVGKQVWLLVALEDGAVAWFMRGPFEWRKGDGHRNGKVDWEVLGTDFAEYKDRILQTGGRWT